MIHVLIEASSPALRAELAALIRDHPGLRLGDGSSESAANSASETTRGTTRGAKASLVRTSSIVAEASEPAFESFGWNAAGVPIILVADDPPPRLRDGGVRRSSALRRPRAPAANVAPAELIAAIEAVAAGLFVLHPSDADSFPGWRPRDPEGATPAPLPVPARFR